MFIAYCVISSYLSPVFPRFDKYLSKIREGYNLSPSRKYAMILKNTGDKEVLFLAA